MSSFLCFIKLIDTKDMTFKAFWKAKLVSHLIHLSSIKMALDHQLPTLIQMKTALKLFKLCNMLF
jgi:hypothetical protein